MYLYETKTGDSMQGDGTFQPIFNQTSLDKADRLEVWATSFSDADEYCEFRLMAGDEMLASSTIRGF